MTPTPVTRLLVANRGEIAVRVIRSARELGVHTIAVHTDVDADTLAVHLADEAWALPGSEDPRRYLDVDAVLDVARRSGADALHPGYGFLSERADAARAALAAGLTWIGPHPDTIDALGDKIRARALAEELGVPLAPGRTLPADLDEARRLLRELGDEAGWPILVKRADGGGGRGITRIDDPAGIDALLDTLPGPDALAGCFAETMITRARHVETQCARDSHGTFRVLSTRDCSVQRRNQKILEEAPAPFLGPDVNRVLADSSRALFDATGYVGLGTCEFLLTEDGPHFLEVNPRLQVEHTVTEEVCGIDLVAEQLRIAAGEPLSPAAGVRGHSIEVRLTSEDPADHLMPTTGRVTRIDWPAGPGVRVDSHLRVGDTIGADYDSLIGKVVVTAPTREAAFARLGRALAETRVDGVHTCLPLLDALRTHPALAATDPTGESFAVTTTWVEECGILDDLAATLRAEDGAGGSSPSRGSGAPGPLTAPATHTAPASAPIAGEANGWEEFTVHLDGRRHTLRLPARLLAGLAGRAATTAAPAASRPHTPRPQVLRRRSRAATPAGGEDPGALTAPLPGTVVRVHAEAGSVVEAGDVVLVLESMKMEKPLTAPTRSRVDAIDVAVGASVASGDLLARLTPLDSDGPGDAPDGGRTDTDRTEQP